MIFLLTDAQLVRAVQSARRTEDGVVALRLPPSCLAGAAPQSALVFCEKTRTVTCGDCTTRLSPIQFALLGYVHEHGCTSFESLQDAVWQGPASDNTIRAAVAKINARLLRSGFAVELTAHRSRVSLESVG